MGLRFMVRAYGSDDAAPLAALVRASVLTLGLNDYSTEQVTAWASNLPDAAAMAARCSDGRQVWVAEDSGSGEILGFTDLESSGHIDMLYVAPGAKGGGVADALTDALVMYARKNAVSDIVVEASEAARRFYRKRGFIERGRKERVIDGVTLHNYAMALKL